MANLGRNSPGIQTRSKTIRIQTPHPSPSIQTPNPSRSIQTPHPSPSIQTPNPSRSIQTPHPSPNIQTPQPSPSIQTPSKIRRNVKEEANQLQSQRDMIISELKRERERFQTKFKGEGINEKSYTPINFVSLTPEVVVSKIDKIWEENRYNKMTTKELRFFSPSTDGNTMYDSQLGRIVFTKKKITTLKTTYTRNTRLFSIFAVLKMVRRLAANNKWTTKSDMWYQGKIIGAFRTRWDCNKAIEDVTCILECTRTSLRVLASEKGLVIGYLQFKDDDNLIDCSRVGPSGKNIPSNIDRVSDIANIDNKALFILLVEKDAVFQILSSNRFYEIFHCIIITGKGTPDVATRLILHKLVNELKLPVYGLFDCNPSGLHMIMLYTIGSKAMCYDSMRLATSGIKWLGLRFKDLKSHNVPDNLMMEMSKKDLELVERLKVDEYLNDKEPWMTDFKSMATSKVKTELQCLSALDIDYLTDIYLPRKFKELDFI